MAELVGLCRVLSDWGQKSVGFCQVVSGLGLCGEKVEGVGSAGGSSSLQIQSSDLLGFKLVGDSPSDTLTVLSGDPTLLNDAGADGTQVSVVLAANAAIGFDTTEHLSSLSIGAGADAKMLSNGQDVLVTNTLSIAGTTSSWTGKLDVGDNDVIIHNGNISTITNQLSSGYAGGSWNGNGIDSSAAATDSSHLTALGSLLNQKSGVVADYSTFAGQNVSATDILIKYTYYADADLNGTINANDYSLLDEGYFHQSTGWLNGDFNYDGSVDGSDYTLTDNAYNSQGSPIADTGDGLPSITLAANQDFPTGILPTLTPDGTTISSWQVDWGGGNTQTFSPTDTVGNPYDDANATYQASFVALDASGNSIYNYPQMNIAVTYVTPPAAPTGLSASVASSSEIDLTWTDHAAVSNGDVIYESTDGGATFYPIDEISSVSAGATNTYQATGLNPGASYEFYVTADGGYAESSATNTVTQTTTFVPPTLDVEGTGTVVEGQPYELDLTATYPDGEAGAIDHWLVDWNDGAGGTSDIVSYAASSDPTAGLAVTHVFNAGIASPTVTVTAVDAINGSFAADPQPVAIRPALSATPSVSVNQSTLTVNWSNTSNISTGTTILLSTDGTTFFAAGSAAAGATSDTITNVNLDTQYWVELQTAGVNGISNVSAPVSVTTPYVAPVLVITPVGTPTEGQQIQLNLSATYADNTPQSDMITDWMVDWGNGQPAVDAGINPGTVSSPNYPTGTGMATVSVSAAAGSHPTLTNSQTVYFTPNQPSGARGNYFNGGTGVSVAWNGQTNLPVTYIVQQSDPTSPAGWQTIGTVAGNPDGNTNTYNFNFPTGSITSGSADGSVYQVITQNDDAPVGDPGTEGNSAPSGPFTLTGNPDTPQS
jgi:hypothetical protein